MPAPVTAVYECSRCHLGIVPTRPHWREVTGWLQARAGGGAHGVHLERPTARYLCVTCMGVLALGHAERSEPTPATAACRECFSRLRRENPGWWREVVGWVQRRGGGTNAIRWATLTGSYLCDECMVRGKTEGEQLSLGL